jgi:hypothetical protein
MLIDYGPTYAGMIIFFVGYAQWLVSMAQAGSSSLDFADGWDSHDHRIDRDARQLRVGTSTNRCLVAGRTGQSLGKRVTKIKLIGEQTEAPIGPTNAFLRDLVHILDAITCVGYLWPLWDDKRQTFADKIMNTIVVYAPPGP